MIVCMFCIFSMLLLITACSKDIKSCEYCKKNVDTICEKEARVDSTWTHDTLFTKDCIVTRFVSKGHSTCPECERNWQYFGDHYCLEIHSKCSKGEYDKCPMKLS